MGKQHVCPWAFVMSALKIAQIKLSDSWTKHQKLQDWLKIVVWFCWFFLNKLFGSCIAFWIMSFGTGFTTHFQAFYKRAKGWNWHISF